MAVIKHVVHHFRQAYEILAELKKKWVMGSSHLYSHLKTAVKKKIKNKKCTRTCSSCDIQCSFTGLSINGSIVMIKESQLNTKNFAGLE